MAENDDLWNTDIDETDAPVEERLQDEGEPDNEDDPVAEEEVEEESEEEESEEEESEEEESEEEEAEDPEIEFEDGRKVKLSEVEKGFMRQEDYSRKTEEIARDRTAYQEMAQIANQKMQEIAAIETQLIEYVQGLIPDEPDITLASTDPGTYNYQKALRDRAVSEVQNLLTMTQNTNQVQQGMSQQEMDAIVRREEDTLLREFPALRDPAKRAQFGESYKKTANHFGFSDDEINSTFDSRLMKMVYYAAIGVNAQQNRKNAKRRIVKRTAKKRGRAAVSPQKSTAALKRLKSSGSIDDAMRVDFDL